MHGEQQLENFLHFEESPEVFPLEYRLLFGLDVDLRALKKKAANEKKTT